MGAWWGLLHSHGRGNLLRIKFIYSVQKQCETDLINRTPMKHFCHEEWKVTETFFLLSPFWHEISDTSWDIFYGVALFLLLLTLIFLTSAYCGQLKPMSLS